MPTRFSDANGRYLGFDRAVHEGGGRTAYTNFSLWDTYRTQHPLLALVKPGRQADMVASLLRMYEQGGYLPKWPLGNGDSCIMIGTPADIVIADTWLRGVRDFDVAKAWEAVMKTAATPVPDGAPSQGRKGVEEYVSLGWVAADRTDQSVSRTLEFAVADAALAGLARGLGKDADAAVLAGRAANWKNLWDANLKLFAPRNADGSWPPFDPLQDMVLGTSTAYTEGNANQYRWFVPHDVPALVTAFGSPEVFVHELAAFLEKGLAEHAAALAEPREPLWWMTNPPKQYWHGNEPCIHAAYLFAFAGRQDLTQEWVHRIADALYHDGPDGLPGNDDAGTLAAWYVFTALGFLPVPGTDLYVLGSPFFPRAEVRLADGTLVVEAPGAGATRPYVKSVTLDGEPLAGPTFPHARIARGGTLRFELSDSPRD
jgi:predicted alpha-1,2-mannosidase